MLQVLNSLQTWHFRLSLYRMNGSYSQHHQTNEYFSAQGLTAVIAQTWKLCSVSTQPDIKGSDSICMKNCWHLCLTFWPQLTHSLIRESHWFLLNLFLCLLKVRKMLSAHWRKMSTLLYVATHDLNKHFSCLADFCTYWKKKASRAAQRKIVIGFLKCKLLIKAIQQYTGSFESKLIRAIQLSSESLM